MENSSLASASSEAGSSRSQEIEELERFIDSYVLEFEVQGLLTDKDEGDKTPPDVSQWTEECNDKLDGLQISPKQRGPSYTQNQNGNKNGSPNMLGTEIWAASTRDSVSGETSWDLQPEKTDFTPLPRKPRSGPKHPLPHIDREGFGKGKCEEGDEVNLNDIEKVLPTWQGYQPRPLDAEIAHTKKVFRKKRSDRRRQPKSQGCNKPPQPNEHPPATAKQNSREHQKQYPGSQALHSSGKQGHHGYSQNRRWHHNQKHPPNDKDHQRHAKESESPKIEDNSVCTAPAPLEAQRSPEATERRSQQRTGGTEPEAKRKDSIQSRERNRPKVTLLPSSKDRLRRRLKEKEEYAVESTNPERTKMDKLIEILNSMRNNSSDVDHKLTTFMEEAQNSANSEEMLEEIVKTIYQKAVTDRSFAHTAAKLCDKMALFMVEGTKFRSLLLNMLEDLILYEPVHQRCLKQTCCESMAVRLRAEIEAKHWRSLPVPASMGGQRPILGSTRSKGSIVDPVFIWYREEPQLFCSTLRHLVAEYPIRKDFLKQAVPCIVKTILQKDFSVREELHKKDVEIWLGFITFLCEVFGTMKSSKGEPFRVLVCPIFTCLRELLQSCDVKEDAVLCCSMELHSTGRLLEEQLPDTMSDLLAVARDKMLSPSESMLSRSLLLEVIELHANNWNPLRPSITQYYNKTIQKLTG